MYNAIRPLDGRRAKVGETVVFGFRTQLYRSNGAVLAVVGGLADNAPRLLGLFDRNGNPVARSRIQGASIRSPAAAFPPVSAAIAVDDEEHVSRAPCRQ